MKVAMLLFVIAVAVAVIVWFVLMYEMYKNETWIFAPYVPPTLSDSCKPLISVTEMTPQQKEERDALVQQLLDS